MTAKIPLPLISVYMPTRNRADLLEKALRSVLEQTWPHLELIIVNDGSTDHTAEVLAQWQGKDSRITVIHNATPLKACASRNIAIKAAQGEFVTGIDDDDEFTPDRLTELYRAYDDRYSFVCSGFTWHNGRSKKNQFCSNATINLATHLNYQVVSNQVLVKRERMLAIGGFDESFVSLQDYDCFTRLIQRYGPAYRVGKPLIKIYALVNANRISTSNHFWKGYQQFIDKHSHLMSAVQIKNMQLRLAMNKGQPISFRDILSTMSAGQTPRKLRFYLKQLLGK